MRRTRLSLTQLEDKLVPAVVDLVGGVLTFTDSGSENNNLTVGVAAGVYSINDSLTPITLGSGAIAAGYKGSGTNTVSGPASAVDGITISVGGGTNTVNLRSVVDPMTVNGENGTTQVNLNSVAPTYIGNLNGIQAEVTVNAGSNTSIMVSDYTGTTRPNPINISATGITGLAPNAIHLNGTLTTLKVYGSNASGLSESYTVDAPDATNFQLFTGGGSDDVTVIAADAGCHHTFNLGGGLDLVTILAGVTVDGEVYGAETENFNTFGFGELV